MRATIGGKRHLCGVKLRPLSNEARTTIALLLGDPLRSHSSTGRLLDMTLSSDNEVVQSSADSAGQAMPINSSSASPVLGLSGRQPFSPFSNSSGQSNNGETDSRKGDTVAAASFQPVGQYNSTGRHSAPVSFAPTAGQVCTLPPS
jgi:hypothetical protein